MPAIQSVMKRLGFVKLRDYGLVLTPEGRILSIRPAVLDDGLGGRIVGWKDDDLAAMELERWSELGRAMAAKPASRPAVATPVAVRPIAPLPQKPVAAPAPQAMKPPPTPQRVVAVASEPVVEEDDWEWTIAIARARAAAEEADQAVAPPPMARVRPLPAAATAMAKSAAEATAKAAVIASRDTQPLSDFDVSDYTSPTNVRLTTKDAVAVPSIATKPAFVKATTVVDTPTPSIASPVAKTAPIAKIAPVVVKPLPLPPPLQIATPAQPSPVVTIPVAAPNRTFARGQSPATVIPIPRMPRVEPGKLSPVVAVRPSTRLAKGTGPVVPPVISTTVVPSNDDKTLPSLLLPSVSRSRSASR
jgi:hypothetical protein